LMGYIFKGSVEGRENRGDRERLDRQT